ncbi:MAG: hypothetical protein JNM07_04205 [Phycisphaerae bacterium]|nr:hypothetical protein [Phycisphaerae bacterium]
MDYQTTDSCPILKNEELEARGRARDRWLISWIPSLPEGDRELVRAVVERGTPEREVAELQGLPLSAVRARVRRLKHRLRSPVFRVVAARSAEWPEDVRAVARACFLRGMSIRAAAGSLGLSYHHARTLRGAATHLARAVVERAARPRPAPDAPGRARA